MSGGRVDMPDEVGFIVTLKDVYDLVSDVKKTVDPIPDKVRSLEERNHDLEGRVRSLERQVWIWVGAASVAGGSVASLIWR